MHHQFTLYARKVPSGGRVFYYYAYDGSGNRLGPWSTGQITKTAARNHCCLLIKENRLLPGLKEIPTFEEYAKGFWDWENSAYLKERKKRRELTQAYADNRQRNLENTLLPYFGKMRLDKISGEVIDGWLDYMIKQKYKNTTTNGHYGTLMTMIKYAVRKKIIERDPFLDVQRLIDDTAERKLITHDEFRALFVGDWRKVWDDDLLRCTANKLAALTGLRSSEVLGLRGEFVFDDHIFVCAQNDGKYGYRPTKTRTKDHIPLAKDVIADLRKLMELNGSGFIFSLTGGDKPVTNKHLYNGLKKALLNIGISEEERLERNIDFHAWRHFCNTELLKAGLTVPQVQAVTRHKSKSCTERYTHIDAMDFTRVSNIQNELLKPKPIAETAVDETVSNTKPVLKLVIPTEEEKEAKRRKAS